MLAKVTSCALIGLEGAIVDVEADLNTRALPPVTLVGLPDAAVKESTERVRAAIVNSGLQYPRGRLTVNLAPADLRKEGPAYDLPIAVALLILAEQIPPDLDGALFLGELSLDGSVRHVNGILPMAHLASELGYKSVFVPQADAPEAALIEGLDRLSRGYPGPAGGPSPRLSSHRTLPGHARPGGRNADLRRGFPGHQGAGARQARAGSGGGRRSQRLDERRARRRQDAARPLAALRSCPP